MNHPDRTRVILTMNDEDGASNFREVSIQSETPIDESGNPVFCVSQLWGTENGIPVVGPGINPGQVIDPWFPAPGGIRFRLFTFLPDPQEKDESRSGEHLLLEDVKHDGLSNFVEAFDPDRPGMHISDSVDFVLIASGEVVLVLERGEVLVKEGDVVIMRGGYHDWRNETDRPCTVVSVMVGAHRRAEKSDGAS